MSNFAELVTKHRVVLDRLQSGEIDELPDNAFEDFYSYYLSTGNMPYGVAKARSGDPYQWTNDRVLEDVKKLELF